ncbi:MAG: hypothetical protein ACKVPX_08965 [Myxococcaceae bacterium]
MLDGFIIEEIKRRERLQREERDRPFVELPVPKPEGKPERRPDAEEEAPKRGVVVIDL